MYYCCLSGEPSEIPKVNEFESDITDLPSCSSNYSRATFATPAPCLATVAIQTLKASTLGEGID